MRCCSNLGGIVSAALTLLVTVASDTAVGRPLPFQHVIASLAVEPIKPRGKLKPRARVQFHALTKGKKGLVAYALTDIVDSGRKYKGHPVFEATIVAPQDLQAKIDYNSPDPLDWLVPFQHRKSLLCVHGFNTQPENWFKECAKYSANGNYTVVPVVWPAGDEGIRSYMDDREKIAPEAAETFHPLLRVAQSLAGTSILCHSMGNYVLRLMAPPHDQHRSKPAFDKIFMVAADVRDNLFNSDQNKSPDGRLNHGKNIAAMASQRVHVLYSTSDLALIGRRFKLKGRTALGARGVHPQKLHKDLRQKVISKNCNSFNKWSWSNKLWHGYHFKSEAIKYYEQKSY